ncbi:MAG: SDR family NAD(P)-dependent oxidoreductase, partial [Saprospiraceae bacterium]
MSENNGKYAFVTGGSRGIGRAISLKLAGEGYNIIINYKSNDEAANELLNELNSNGGNHVLLKYDVG